MPPRKKLTIKEKKFTKALVKSGNVADAVLDAGYNCKDRNVARSLGHKMIAKPIIQKAIDIVIDDLYPEAASESIGVLREILNDPTQGSMARIKAIETLAKFKGWNAPTKHMTAKVNIDKKYKLPGEQE